MAAEMGSPPGGGFREDGMAIRHASVDTISDLPTTSKFPARHNLCRARTSPEVCGSKLHDYQDIAPDASVVQNNYWLSSTHDNSDDEDDAPQRQAKRCVAYSSGPGRQFGLTFHLPIPHHRGSGGKSSKFLQSILKGFGQSSAKKAPWGGYHRDGILPNSKVIFRARPLQNICH